MKRSKSNYRGILGSLFCKSVIIYKKGLEMLRQNTMRQRPSKDSSKEVDFVVVVVSKQDITRWLSKFIFLAKARIFLTR